MEFKGLSPELQEKLQEVKTPDELVALAKEQGVELTDDQLSAIAGGEDLWDQTHRDDCAKFIVCWTDAL